MVSGTTVPAYKPHGTFMHDNEELVSLITKNKKKFYVPLGFGLTKEQQSEILRANLAKALPAIKERTHDGYVIYIVGTRYVVVDPDDEVLPFSYATLAAAINGISGHRMASHQSTDREEQANRSRRP